MHKLAGLTLALLCVASAAKPASVARRVVAIMERSKVNQLLVVDESATPGVLVGALNMHDLFRAKVV